MKIIYPVNF